MIKTKLWSEHRKSSLGLLTGPRERYFPFNETIYELDGNDFCHHFGKYISEAYNNRLKEMFMGLYL